MRWTNGRNAAVGRTLTALLPLVILATVGTARAATNELIHVGRAMSVVDDVQGRMGTQPPTRIIVNEKLFYEQHIITTNNSRSVVEFRDGSQLQIGPNAIVSLDKFVFNPFESKSEKVITSIAGAFRYISGMETKSSSIEIRTPTATIGIRGSSAEWLVHPHLPTFFSLQHGIATVDTLAGHVELNPGQSVAVVSRNSPPTQPSQTPAPVAAQVIAHINKAVGNLPGQGTPLTTAQTKSDTNANLLPVNIQAADQKGKLAALNALAHVPALKDVPLLQKAAALGLFSKPPGQPLTPAQRAFIAQATKDVPNAAQIIGAAVQQADRATKNNAARSTKQVIGGAAQFGNKGKLASGLANVVKADPRQTGVAVGTAVKFAPGLALAIVTSAGRALPGKAADIAGSAISADPNLAAAIAAALGSINPSALNDIARAAAKAAPGKAADILAALSNLPGADRATLLASISSVLPPQQQAALLSNVTPAAGGTTTTGGTTPTAFSDITGGGGTSGGTTTQENPNQTRQAPPPSLPPGPPVQTPPTSPAYPVYIE